MSGDVCSGIVCVQVCECEYWVCQVWVCAITNMWVGWRRPSMSEIFCGWVHAYSSITCLPLWVRSFGKVHMKCSENASIQGLMQENAATKAYYGSKNPLGLLPKLALALTLLPASGIGFGHLLLEHDYSSWCQPRISELCYGSGLPPLSSDSVQWHCETSLFHLCLLSMTLLRKCSWKCHFSSSGLCIYFIT